MRQDKLARMLAIIIIVLTLVLSGYLYISPLKQASIPRDQLKASVSKTSPQQITLSGTVNNTTKYTIERIVITVCLIDEEDQLIEKHFIYNNEYKAGESGEFTKSITYDGLKVVRMEIEEIRCTYDKLDWYIPVIIGVAAFILLKILCANRKYYIDVAGKEVVVFAGWRKTGIIVDGVLIKEAKLPAVPFEVAVFSVKINGHKLKYYTLNGDLLPSINAFVDNVSAHFNKVRQNIFVRMMDEGVVRGSGDISMKSVHDIEGEKADRYNEKMRKNKGKESPEPAKQKKICPYCGAVNYSNDKCSGCGGNLD